MQISVHVGREEEIDAFIATIVDQKVVIEDAADVSKVQVAWSGCVGASLVKNVIHRLIEYDEHCLTSSQLGLLPGWLDIINVFDLEVVAQQLILEDVDVV